MRNFRLKIINTIARVKQQKNKLAKNFVLVLFYYIYAGPSLVVLYLILFLVSLPFFLVWSPNKSFDYLTPRDEKGQYLGSYNRHVLVYKASVATTIIAVLIVIAKILSVVVVSELFFWPWKVEAAATCTAPTVSMSTPTTTTYCNADGTFAMNGSWDGGTGSSCSALDMTWQYCNCANSTCSSCVSYTTIPTSGAPFISASANPELTAEDTSNTNTITCKTNGTYGVRMYIYFEPPLIPKNSSTKFVVVGPPTQPTNFSHSINTTSSINWTWTDADISEANFYVHDSSHAAKTGSVTGNGSTVASQETGLSANTQYTRHANAYSTNGNTDSDPASVYTSIETPSGISFDTIAATSLIVSATGSFSNLASGSSGLYFAESITSTNSGWIQTNSWQKTGLTKNTQYSYTVKARNGNTDETSTTSAATKYTLAADANVSGSVAFSTWTNSAITFTNNAGFGAGGVQYYRYVLDQSATHVWADNETQWNSSTLQLTPTSDANNWYLHVKAYNGDNTAAGSGATQDLGPYYYDATAPAPNPSAGSATANSTTQITWSFDETTDATSGLAASPYSFNNGSDWQAGTTYVRNSLTANTQYTQNLKAKDATGNQTTAGAVSKYTLSKAPSASSISADKSTSTWYNNNTFTFTNNDGFGAGGVEYYRYVWDQNAAYTWTGSETQWTTGTKALTATSEGSWYLHVKGYNGEGAANGTYDYGLYYYDATSPTITNNVTGDDTWRNSAGTTYNVDFGNGGSGSDLDYAQYAIGRTPGATDLRDWTDIFTTNTASYNTNWSVDFSSLQEGTNYISYKVCDTAGNCEEKTTSGYFYINKDTIPAAVSNINVSPDLTSATVSWTTSEGATSQIEWGATDSYGNFTALDSNLATTHSRTVSSLTAGQTYHFRVVAEDRATNETLSTDQTFATSSLPATTIANVQVTNISTTSVKVTWTTNHGATSRVRYGLTTAYGSEVTDSNLVTSHEITITGLSAGTTYHYEVMSQGNTYAYDADATFTTQAAAAEEEEEEPAPTPTPSTLASPTVLSPEADQTISEKRPTITGLARSNNTIFIFIDSELENTVLSTNHASGTGSFAYKLRRDLSVGTHTVYTIARNSSNAYSDRSTKITFEVKLPYIAPTLFQPVEKQAVTEDGHTVIPGIAHNNSTIKVYVDGVLFDSFQVENNSSGTANFAYNLDLSKLTDGQHSVYTIAYDQNGNPSLKSKTYTISKNAVYIVKKGDSLWKIAKAKLGNGRLYTRIVEANKKTHPELLFNPGLIRPGWKLQIP